MRNIFSKRTFVIAGITYFLIAVAYLIGLTVKMGNGFLALPRRVDATMLALLVTPFVVGLSIVYILVWIKSRHVLIGYLILTVVVSGVAGGTVFTINKLLNSVHDRQTAEKTQQQIDYVYGTIAPVILDKYPNAQFKMDQFGVVVNLDGYKYQAQPNPNDEIAKCIEMKQNPIFSNYPYNIRIDYYFENTNDNFASLFFDDYSFNYYCLGMSKEALEQLAAVLQEYLKNYHSDFIIESDYSISVSINQPLQSDDEAAETKLWHEFVRINDINTELVEITVAYRHPDNPSSARQYNVRQDRWYYDNTLLPVPS